MKMKKMIGKYRALNAKLDRINEEQNQVIEETENLLNRSDFKDRVRDDLRFIFLQEGYDLPNDTRMEAGEFEGVKVDLFVHIPWGPKAYEEIKEMGMYDRFRHYPWHECVVVINEKKVGI